MLSDGELAVFALIAARHGPGEIAKELSIGRETVESYCERIKLKLGYPDADALKRGAREILGRGSNPAFRHELHEFSLNITDLNRMV